MASASPNFTPLEFNTSFTNELSSSSTGSLSSDILLNDEFKSITAALSRNQEEVSMGAVQLLNQIMQKNRSIRSILAHQDPPIILQRLAQLMSKHPISPQLLYEIFICFWILTFQTSTASLFRDWGIIPLIKENCSSSSTEKIIRIGLAIFRNLLVFARQETSSLLVGCKVLEWVRQLASLKRFSDEEMLADIQFLQTELALIYQNLRFQYVLSLAHSTSMPQKSGADYFLGLQHIAQMHFGR